jgi:rhodanese-related sulfurtransferase
VLYQTVDPVELCPTLEQNKGYLLLDVRSKGENFDTSSSLGLNIGHLKGAKNIDVRELGVRLSEIREYKDQPVFVYCSHSQRSRRASKMLVDSGFTKVYNINGGLTALYNYTSEKNSCLPMMIETNIGYSIISPAQLCSGISAGKKYFFLDVRTDSAFRHLTSDAKTNALGYFKGSINIPVNELEAKLSLVPKEKEIIVTDISGGDAAKAAALLKQHDYARVSILIEGVNRWLTTDEKELPCKYNLYLSPANYRILTTKEFGRFTQAKTNYLLLDVRTEDEFANKAKDSWRNIGHLKNAINIPEAELKSRMNELEKFREKEIVIYAFSGSPEAFSAAQTLHNNGFKNISVLTSGLFNIRWLAANDKSQSYLKDLVTDVPEINW